MARLVQGLTVVGVSLALGLACLAQDPIAPAKGIRTTQKQGKAKGKRGEIAKPAVEVPAKAEGTTPAADDGTIKFSRDIAPILAANCIRCHNEKHRSKFDQTTFKSILAGGMIGDAIVPGKADMSHLVLRIKGEDEGARMPPGQNRLGPEAIAKIEAWVNDGAQLDAGLDPTKLITSYAAKPDDLKRARLAKLPVAELDKLTEAKAKERLTKASPNVVIEVYPGKHFLLFGKLPKARADATLKLMETQYARLRGLLTFQGKSVLDGPEKVSLYIFNDRASYVEFVRSNEAREVETGVEGHGNMSVESPYLAVIDPAAGREETPVPKKVAKSKKGSSASDEASGPERSLGGLLTENLAMSATSVTGKAPRWLSLGLGAYMGSVVELRSPYYSRQRSIAFEQARKGWRDQAQEALGGQLPDEKVRAIGFAFMEYLAINQSQVFPSFVNGMLEGQEKLDEVIGQTLEVNREQFLGGVGDFVAVSYGRSR